MNAGNAATAGAMFNFTNTNTTAGLYWLESLTLLGGYDQIRFQGGQNTYVIDCVQQFFVDDGIHYGPSYAGIGIISGVSMAGIVSGTGTNTGCGILCEGGDTFVWQNSNIASLYSDIVVKPAASGFVRNLFASNVLCDGATRTTGTAGWTFDSSNSSAQNSTRASLQLLGRFLRRRRLQLSWRAWADAGRVSCHRQRTARLSFSLRQPG